MQSSAVPASAFVAVLSVRWMASYYLLGGFLIALQYHRWSHGSWYFGDSYSVWPATAETEFLGFALWVICVAIVSYLISSLFVRRIHPVNS